MKYYDFIKTKTDMKIGLTFLNIKENPFQILNKANKVDKSHKKIIIFESENYDELLKVSKKGLVDVINHTSQIDKTLLKFITETNTSLNLPFSKLLVNKNFTLLVKDYKEIVKLSKKTKTRIIISSFASNKEELVPVDGLISFAEFLGFNKKQARETLSFVQEKLLERIKS